MKEFFLERQVLIMTFDESRLRLVCNNGVDCEGIRKTLQVYEEFVKLFSSK